MDERSDMGPDDLPPEPAADPGTGPGPEAQEALAARGPRASDADRDRFAGMLERHYVEGRLSEDEFSERMDRVLRARTLVELYALSSDLPDPPAVDVPRAVPGQKRHAWRFWRT